jgi:hypothetical protein
MGDRRQVIFEFGQPNKPENEALLKSIVFYTHWGGCSLPTDLLNAIDKAKGRWTDENYCARIIISQLIGNDWDEETGYGLDVARMDSEYDDFYVNLPSCSVRLGIAGKPVSFGDFQRFVLNMAMNGQE